MLNIETWLTEYGKSHQHPINVAIHKVAVPLIVLSVMGLAWSISVDLTVVLVATALLFYLRLSWKMALGMVFFFGFEFFAIYFLVLNVAIPIWVISTVIFVFAWVMQFVGHAIEGKKPSFLHDLVFLLIGPAWVIAPIYRAMGIKF